MSNYGPLLQIKDPAAKALLRMVVDQIGALSGRLDGGPSWKTNVNAGEFRVTNAADAIDGMDLTTLQQVESFLLADVLRRRLEAGGDAELNVSGLAGRLSEPQQMGVVVIPNDQSLPNVNTALPYEVVSWQGKLYYFSPTTNPGRWVPLTAAASIIADTHANRLLLYPAASQSTGTMFWETDRTALYYITTTAGVNAWQLMLSRPMSDLIANRPADLGTTDAGFWFVVIDQGQVTQQWTGTAWVYQQGILNNTFANRPAVGTTAAGFRFRATDYGYQTWRSTGAAWVLEEGVGGPMRATTIAADLRPAGLGANDAGFMFFSTDAGVTYRWSGAAWTLSPTIFPYLRQIKNGTQAIPAGGVFTRVTTWSTTAAGVIAGGDTVTVPTPSGGTPSVWHVKAQINWDVTPGLTLYATVRVNGTPVATTGITGMNAQLIQEVCADIFNLVDGDVIDVAVQHTSGAAVNVFAGFTTMTVYRTV